MTTSEGAPQSASDPLEVLSVADAAIECGVTKGTFISWLVDCGVLLVIPGTEDPRCEWMVVDGVAYHVEDCECRFVASPHPDIVPMDEAGR